MSFETEIIKRKGIENLVSGYSPGKVEEEQKAIITGDRALSEAMDAYEKYLTNDEMMNIEPLTPGEITEFIPLTAAYEGTPGFSIRTGLFIKYLVAVSYANEYNDFIINTRILPKMNYLERGWDGILPELLRIDINGDSKGFVNRTRHVDFGLWGGDYAFEDVEDSIFTIAGGTTITHYGIITDSLFRTDDKEMLEELIENVPAYFMDKATGNKIIFVEDGEEEVVADYK